jgi:hypothetical protein
LCILPTRVLRYVLNFFFPSVVPMKSNMCVCTCRPALYMTWRVRQKPSRISIVRCTAIWRCYLIESLWWLEAFGTGAAFLKVRPTCDQILTGLAWGEKRSRDEALGSSRVKQYQMVLKKTIDFFYPLSYPRCVMLSARWTEAPESLHGLKHQVDINSLLLFPYQSWGIFFNFW